MTAQIEKRGKLLINNRIENDPGLLIDAVYDLLQLFLVPDHRIHMLEWHGRMKLCGDSPTG